MQHQLCADCAIVGMAGEVFTARRVFFASAVKDRLCSCLVCRNRSTSYAVTVLLWGRLASYWLRVLCSLRLL